MVYESAHRLANLTDAVRLVIEHVLLRGVLVAGHLVYLSFNIKESELFLLTIVNVDLSTWFSCPIFGERRVLMLEKIFLSRKITKRKGPAEQKKNARIGRTAMSL